eukprot:g53318.t1
MQQTYCHSDGKHKTVIRTYVLTWTFHDLKITFRKIIIVQSIAPLTLLNTPPRTGSKACEMGNSPVSASLTSQAEEEYEADFTLTTPVPAPKHVGIPTNPLLHRHAQSGVESKRVPRTIVQEREWSDALHYYDSIPKTNPDTVRKQPGVLELLKFAKLSECNLKIMESPSQNIGSNDCFVFAIAMAVSLLHGLGPVRKDQYAGKSSVHVWTQRLIMHACVTVDWLVSLHALALEQEWRVSHLHALLPVLGGVFKDSNVPEVGSTNDDLEEGMN